MDSIKKSLSGIVACAAMLPSLAWAQGQSTAGVGYDVLVQQLGDGSRPLLDVVGSAVQFYQEIGGLVGRFVLAYLAIRIVSRRNLLRIFQVPGLFVLPLVFLYFAINDLELLKWGIFFVGLLTVEVVDQPDLSNLRHRDASVLRCPNTACAVLPTNI